MRVLAFVALALLLVGCSDSTGPDFPNAEGRYSGQWDTEALRGGERLTGECTGYVLIASQSDADISGEVLLGPGFGCSDVVLEMSGTITTGGSVELHVPVWDADLDSCTGDTALKGSLSGNRLTLAFGPVVCPEEGTEVTVSASFLGTR